MEKDLISKFEELQCVLSKMPVAAAIVKKEGEVLFCSDSFAQMIRVKSSVKTNLFKISFFSKDDKNKIEENFNEILTSKGEFVYSAKIVNKDGSAKIFEINGGTIDCMRDSIFLIFKDVTEKREMENNLKESEEKYRNLVERANDGIVIVHNHLVKYVNPHLVNLLGYKKEEAIGKDYTMFIAPGELPKVIEYDKLRMTGKEVPNVYESKVINKNGKEIDVEFNVGIIMIGEEKGDLVIIRDLTERKKIEKDLKEKEANFQALVDNANDSIIVFSGDKGMTVYANKKAQELTGYFDEEIYTKNIKSFVHPNDFMGVAEKYQKRMRGEKVEQRYNIRVINKKGEAIPVELSVSRIFWSGKSASLAMLVDLRDRKRIEDSLIASEEKFRTIVQNINIGVYRLIPDLDLKNNIVHGKFIQVNQAMINIFGYESEEEFLKLDVSDLYSESSAVKAYIEAIQKKGFAKNIEFQGKKKDGTLIEVSVTSKAQYGDKNKIKWIDGVIEDVTEKKKAERGLNDNIEELARMNDLMIGRELKMLELKNQIKKLEEQIK